MDQQPPDLDEHGHPIGAAPPDLDAQGRPVHSVTPDPVTGASAEHKNPLAIGLEMGKSLLTDPAYRSGFLKSAGDTAKQTGAGILEGVEYGLNPVNLVRGPYELGKDVLTNGGQNTIAGLKAIASGDPRAGGNAIGNLATGAAVGRGLGMLRTAVSPSPAMIGDIPAADLDTARINGDTFKIGQGTRDILANGRPSNPPLRIVSSKPSTPTPQASLTPTSGNLALKPELPPELPSPTPPRVLTLKETPTSWTPEAARARIEMNDWHSGVEPGTPEAQQASALHKYDGETQSRYRYLLDSPNGFGVRDLTANPGRTVAAAAGSWAAHKLGLPAYLGIAAGYMSPEIALGGAQFATSPQGAAAIRAALLAQLTSGTTGTSAEPR